MRKLRPEKERHLPKVTQSSIHIAGQSIATSQESKSSAPSLHSTEKSLPAPIGFCSASHHMTLDKSLSLSNLQIFKLWNEEVGSDYSYGSIRTQTQSFNGWVSPDFQVLAHLNNAEPPPPNTPEKNCTPLHYRWIHSRINRRAFSPPPRGPGTGLNTLHVVSYFIIKNSLESEYYSPQFLYEETEALRG